MGMSRFPNFRGAAAPVAIRLALLGGVLALSACDAAEPAAPASPPVEPGAVASGGKPGAEAAVGPAQVESAVAVAAASDGASPDAAALTDKVWRVCTSTAVEPGTTYVFLANGTLVIDGPHGTPLYGRWAQQEGALHLTEEGIRYRTEILELGDGQLRLRSHNPGEPVDITLVAAPGEPLPPSRPGPAADPETGTGGAR